MATKTEADHVSLIICDDERLLTDALAIAVRTFAPLALAAAPFNDSDDAIAACERLHPDAVLIGDHLEKGPDGIEATRRIKQVSPDTVVVILTADRREQLFLEAMEAGALGVVHKSEPLGQVLAAVQTAARGEPIMDPRQLLSLIETAVAQRHEWREAEYRLGKLTHRERQILALLGEGMRNEQIGNELFISPRTVETHVQNILRKLQVHSKLEAVAYASRWQRPISA
jgi:NarL family two-component system response regulator LiaR